MLTNCLTFTYCFYIKNNSILYIFIDDTLISGQGCYLDKSSDRDLPYAMVIAKVTPSLCVEECSKKGYKYAGVQVT